MHNIDRWHQRHCPHAMRQFDCTLFDHNQGQPQLICRYGNTLPSAVQNSASAQIATLDLEPLTGPSSRTLLLSRALAQA